MLSGEIEAIEMNILICLPFNMEGTQLPTFDLCSSQEPMLSLIRAAKPKENLKFIKNSYPIIVTQIDVVDNNIEKSVLYTTLLVNSNLTIKKIMKKRIPNP